METTVAVASIGSMLSVIMEIWFVGVVVANKLFSPTMKLFLLFAFIEFLSVVLAILGYAVGVCVATFLLFQYCSLAVWLLSLCTAINILLCVYASGIDPDRFRKLQYFFYAVILGVPLIICIVLLASGVVVLEQDPAFKERCLYYSPRYAEIITYILPYFLIFATNIVLSFIIIYRLLVVKFSVLKMLGKESKRNMTLFLTIVFVFFGVYRAPTLVWFVNLARERSNPSWASVMVVADASWEGFVILVIVSFYFKLFGKFWRSCKRKLGYEVTSAHSTTENQSASAPPTIEVTIKSDSEVQEETIEM